MTCNALEWQAAEGGGKIIESDKTISVNNPRAIRAWERARKWIGRISPPGVTAYQERDSQNVFDSGRAAFNRIWLGRGISRSEQGRQNYWRTSRSVVNTGFSSIPGGSAGSAATVGGFGLAVSAHSQHRREAVSYLLFLIRAQVRLGEVSPHSGSEPKPLDGPPRVDPHSQFEQAMQSGGNLVDRPAVETGKNYRRVSEAYAAAVHSVLTGQKSAQEAAGHLEAQLIEMTGFQPARSGKRARRESPRNESE